MFNIFASKKENETEKARKFYQSLRIPYIERYDYYSSLSTFEKEVYLRKGGVPLDFPIPISGKMYKDSQLLFKKIKLFREGFMFETHKDKEPIEQSVSSKIKSVNLLYDSSKVGEDYRNVWNINLIYSALEEYERYQRIDDDCFTDYDLEFETEFDEIKCMISHTDKYNNIKLFLSP